LALAGRADGSIDLYLLESGTLIHTFGAPPEEAEGGKRGGDAVADVAFSPAGGLFAATEEKSVKLVSLANWETLRELRGHAGPVSAIAFSPDGKTILTGSRDRALKVWDAATGAELRSIGEHAGS